MTARERTVIGAIVDALMGGSTERVDALSVAYGIPVHGFQPIKYRAAALLQALIEASNDRP
jgi:hypothetical protein